MIFKQLMENLDIIISDIDKIDNDKTQIIDLLVSDNVKKEEVSESVVKKDKKNAFNKKSKRKKFFNGKFYLDILDILIIILITAIISCIVSGYILNRQYKKNNIFNVTSLKEDKALSEFIQMYSEIKDNYYEEVDSEGLIDAAIDGMLQHLEDKYSIYFDKNSSDAFDDYLDGTYTGIGILASGATVLEVYENSPAEAAGIEPGDVIIKVNGKDIKDDNASDISTLIKENDGESTVVVKRSNNELTFKLKTDNVTINMATKKVIEKGNKKIGYLGLSSFSSKSHEQFAEALIELEKEGIESLIIDLRGNSGGYLSSMESIASLFVEKDKVLYGIQTKDDITYTSDKTEDKREYNIVVLVNGNSASAAEMLTAALKESYGAKVVGKTTFGKGTAQKVVHSGETSYKYTAFKWLTPNGECIDGVGIKPDYEVNNTINNNIINDKQLDTLRKFLKVPNKLKKEGKIRIGDYMSPHVDISEFDTMDKYSFEYRKKHNRR